MADGATLSPAQSVQLLAIGVMLRDDELEIVGEGAGLALAALIDVSQEIALQMGGEPEKSD